MAGGSPAPNRLQRDLTTLFQVGTAAGLSDRELIARISRSSFEEAEASFQALVTRHGPMVLRVCRNVLNDPHDAEDAFQATFLVLVRRFRTIRNHDAIGSWLYGVAARVSARSRVEAAKRRKHERGMMRLAVVSAPDDSAFHDLAVQEEVLRLPDRYRSVVVLCYWEGLTHEQAAARLNCPLGTVRSRMARARGLLRKRLVRRGVSDVDPAPAVLPLSSALVQSTVQAAAKVASGQVVSNVAAAHVAGLTLQVARRMIMMKVGMVAAPTCLVLAASIGLGLGAQEAKRLDADGKAGFENAGSAQKEVPPKPDLSDYVVEPPDELLVELPDVLPGKRMWEKQPVRGDGTILLGVHGRVSVAGLTTLEIKEQLVKRLQRYLSDEVLGLVKEDPVAGEIKRVAPRDTDRITVEVTRINSKNYYVLGEIPRPGKFPLIQRVTILDAVALAGGLTSRSDLHRIYLVRDQSKGVSKPLPVHLDKITTGGDPSTNYTLQPGDRLVVYRDPRFRAANDGRSPATSLETKDEDAEESDHPEGAPGLEGKVERLERRLRTVEAQLRKIVERLDEPR